MLGRPTESCTHIVYKSGRPSTLSWWRKQETPPHIVGISWVTKSKEAGKRLDEEPYRVEVEEEDIFQKVRIDAAQGIQVQRLIQDSGGRVWSRNFLRCRRRQASAQGVSLFQPSGDQC